MTPDLDMVIRGARTVTPGSTLELDVGLKEGRIAALAEPGTLNATHVLEADGLDLVPGGVDPHVHINLEFRGHRLRHDYWTGTVAALHGGTTTVMNFAFQTPTDLPSEAVQKRLEEAEGQAACDFSLHACVTRGDKATLEDLSRLMELGVSSLKVFLVYPDAGLFVSDPEFYAILRTAGQVGLLTMVHAENEAMVQEATEQLAQAGRLLPGDYPHSRPVAAEVEAVSRTLTLAEMAGAAVYIVHVTSQAALEQIAQARHREVRVFGETCPHYLLLTEAAYTEANGVNYIMSPPLRSERDRQALWDGLRNGDLATVGSDDTAWDSDQKRTGATDFREAPPGVPGIETRLPLLYSEGVQRGKISLERFVELVSSNPARLFGLYPRKGAIQVGSDADLVLLDPSATWRLQASQHHMQVDYSPYEGREMRGGIVAVVSRGRVAVKDGELRAQPGWGQYLPARQMMEPNFTRR